MGGRFGLDLSQARRALLLLLAYGAVFTLLRASAALWASGQLFSLLFPAAGWRFAFLWRMGPRWTIPAALAEAAVSLASGSVDIDQAPLLQLAGVVGPCLMYGAAIALVKARASRLERPGGEPLTFALAALASPIAGSIGALPWVVPLALENGPLDWTALVRALLVFVIGDLVGILLIAPPLIWAARRWRRRSARAAPVRPAPGDIAIPLAAFLLGWGTSLLIERLGLGQSLAPVVIAAIFIGYRGGSAGAWLAILANAVIIALIGPNVSSTGPIADAHLTLAAIAVTAYLAGAFIDSQRRAAIAIARRDRLLLQAERLKSLRAMSVAVIHELAQPLSVIAIEAEGLADATPEERAFATRLIASKARHLADLTQRLRGFGSGGTEAAQPVALITLVRDTVDMACFEQPAARRAIRIDEGPAATLMINRVDVQQALLNLLRNALAASPAGATVMVGWSVDEAGANIEVANPCARPLAEADGLGIGLMIARSLIRANGGELDVHRAHSDFRALARLPLASGPA